MLTVQGLPYKDGSGARYFDEIVVTEPQTLPAFILTFTTESIQAPYHEEAVSTTNFQNGENEESHSEEEQNLDPFQEGDPKMKNPQAFNSQSTYDEESRNPLFWRAPSTQEVELEKIQKRAFFQIQKLMLKKQSRLILGQPS